MKPERLEFLKACVHNASCYQSGILELLNEVYACRAVIDECGKKFREYERLHMEKAQGMSFPDERFEKANNNAKMAIKCEEILNK